MINLMINLKILKILKFEMSSKNHCDDDHDDDDPIFHKTARREAVSAQN